SVLLWSAWLVPAIAFFSVAGFFHRYYLVMIAPPTAALAGIGLAVLWEAYRRGGWQAWLLPLVLGAVAVFQAVLLRPYPDWNRWLTPLIISLGGAAVAGLVLGRLHLPVRVTRTIQLTALGAGVAAVLVAPAVWSLATARQANSGALPAGG